MKVTFVVPNYAPSLGGAQEHVRQLAEGLARRGHEVEVLTSDAIRSVGSKDPGRIEPALEQLGGVTVRRGHVVDLLRRGQRAVRWLARRMPWAAEDLLDYMLHPILAGPMAPRLWRDIVRASRRDGVVVACSAPFLTMVLPAAWRGRARVIAMPLLHASRSTPNRTVRWALRRCDATTASTVFEREVQQRLGIAAERVAVLPPGTEPSAFPLLGPVDARRELGLPERPTVGYVGRLVAYKGVDTLLDAAPFIWEREPDTTILLAGADTGWAGVRDHPSIALGGDRVVVRQDFADDERGTLLAACDAVAFPSREESFGLGIIEAWSARRGVVAADIPAVRTVVREGHDADLFPVGDGRALADGILGLLADPDRARAMGEAGRRHVEDDLGWDGVVERWDAFIGAVADGRADAALVVSEVA